MIIGFLGSIGTDGLGSVVRVPGTFAKINALAWAELQVWFFHTGGLSSQTTWLEGVVGWELTTVTSEMQCVDEVASKTSTGSCAGPTQNPIALYLL